MGSWYLDCWIGLPENRFDGLHTGWARVSGGGGVQVYLYKYSREKRNGGVSAGVFAARSQSPGLFSLGVVR